MNNINNNEDVLAWAKTIVEGKGEKYSVLSKGDQFAIATYITELADKECPAVGEGVTSGISTTTPEEARETYAGDPPNDFAIAHPEVCQTRGRVDTDTMTLPKDDVNQPTIPMRTVREVLLAKGIKTAQEAYDAFLKATAGDEKSRRVIDFSNGVMNVGPAFTWWVLGLLGEGGGNGL